MSAYVIPTMAARDDLQRILVYFLDENEPNVAARFANAYEETVRFIGDFPELGIPWESAEPRLNNVRVKLIHGFEKYLVFYRLSGDRAYILRIFHGHQNIENLL